LKCRRGGCLEPGHDGRRHYLEGRPVHCGDALELQRRQERQDLDGNLFSAPVPDDGVFVRYEARQERDGAHVALVVTLYADVAGHSFRKALEPWIRFRWPLERRTQ
jgi:hypothetical protein